MNDAQLPQWVSYLQAFSVPTLAAFGVFIAWRQWQTAHDKLRLELFEKRVEVFNLIDDFMQRTIREGVTGPMDFNLSWSARSKARFLFGKDVHDFLKEVHELAARIRSQHLQLTAQQDRGVMIEMQLLDLRSFNALFETLHEPFSSYMKFENQLGRRTWFDCLRDYIWR